MAAINKPLTLNVIDDDSFIMDVSKKILDAYPFELKLKITKGRYPNYNIVDINGNNIVTVGAYRKTLYSGNILYTVELNAVDEIISELKEYLNSSIHYEKTLPIIG